MYVNRLRLFNVKPLRCDIPGEGAELPEPARRRLLLQGGNGSGKTTILETIRVLWEFLGEWIDRGSGKPPVASQSRHYLFASDLAAMELVGLLPADQPLWIGIAGANDWKDLKSAHPEAQFAGLIRYGKKEEPGQARIELPPGRDWKTLRASSLVGRESLPNIVHFPPDQRTVAGPPKDGARLVDTTALNWSALYGPKLDLDSLLLTVKALRPESYAQTLDLVNLALGHRHKRIIDFGEDGRLIVDGHTEYGRAYSHTVEELSSGERQMLLMMAYTVGFLREGGLVLMDEPDLHIHPAMVSQLMGSIESVVDVRRGQMIVASHSDLVWDWFSRDEERIQLGHWRRDPR